MNAYQAEQYFYKAARVLERREIEITVENLQAIADLQMVSIDPDTSLLAAQFIAECYQ
tara:strand:- start:192 stop:365 length:174 start_codon:yes stop_codon:yes gene_type:complete